LLAEAIAREEQRLLRLVPNVESEHPVEACQGPLAPLLPGMHDDFGVAARAELVAARVELLVELRKIVDLAIEADTDRAVFVEQRLAAQGREVDDRQTPVAEPDARRDVEAGIIRPAVMQRVGHAREQRRVDRSCRDGIEYAGNAAHRCPLLTLCPRAVAPHAAHRPPMTSSSSATWSAAVRCQV